MNAARRGVLFIEEAYGIHGYEVPDIGRRVINDA